MRDPDRRVWSDLWEALAYWSMLMMATAAFCLFLLAGCPSLQLGY
jgi:hypothetical protein